MRGDTVFRIYGVHRGRDKDCYFGTFRTLAQAIAKVEVLRAKEMHGANWARQYHDQGFVIREAVVETDFEIPSRPKPRDKYFATQTAAPSDPETWNYSAIDVLRRESGAAGVRKICSYQRHHAMFQTFEPFRQGDHEYALVSRDYTRTAVLDLTAGEIIAEESATVHSGGGFCPVGFYVPDWWDVHDDSVIPGSEQWREANEWPDGRFGFVWGCTWGDDSSWKVQYLDLSRIREGVIARDERFGYLELATSTYRSPALSPDAPDPAGSKPPSFIDISRRRTGSVRFAIEMEFDLATGKSEEWQRLKVSNPE
jgi:hypothetical protein